MSTTANENIRRHEASITRAQRIARLDARGATLWFTGLSGSGKSTIACALEKELITAGVFAYRLDGDNLRLGLNRDLGFDASGRAENIRRIAQVARLFADSGAIAIVCAISPFRADRDAARRLHGDDPGGPLPFFEIHVDTPLEVCEQRDPKGLYRKVRRHEIHDFTGIDSPYEPPAIPDCVLNGHTVDLNESVRALLRLLLHAGIRAVGGF